MIVFRGFLFLLLTSTLVSCVFSQSNTLDELDKELSHDYHSYYQNRHHYESRDIILNGFKIKLLEVLKTTNVQEYSFDALNKIADSIKVGFKTVSTADHKLKIISWDELSGGTWHTYNSAYQYATKQGVMADLFVLDKHHSANAICTDALYVEAYHIEEKKYLVKGYGTHGAGHDFYIFRLLDFNIKGKVKDVAKAFDTDDVFVFYKPRALKIEPIFSKKDYTITYPEIKPAQHEGEATGFSESSAKYKKIMYKNGRFTAL